MTIVGDAAVRLRLANMQEYRTDLVDAENTTRVKMRGVMDTLSKFGIASAGSFALFAAKLATDLASTYKKIEHGTAATEEETEAIKKSLIDVLKVVPVGSDKASDALLILHRQLGLVGDDLTEAAIASLNYGRITGQDVIPHLRDLTSTMRVLGDETSVVEVFEALLHVSQRTGLTMGDLAGTLTQNRTELRVLGLDVIGTVGILGALDIAGVDASEMFSTLEVRMRHLRNETGAGAHILEDLRATLEATTDPTERLVALQRAFGDDALLVRDALDEQVVSLEDLTGGLEVTSDKLGEVEGSFLSLGEVGQRFASNIQAELQPVSEIVVEIADANTNWLSVLESVSSITMPGLMDILARSKSSLAGNKKEAKELHDWLVRIRDLEIKNPIVAPFGSPAYDAEAASQGPDSFGVLSVADRIQLALNKRDADRRAREASEAEDKAAAFTEAFEQKLADYLQDQITTPGVYVPGATGSPDLSSSGSPHAPEGHYESERLRQNELSNRLRGDYDDWFWEDGV